MVRVIHRGRRIRSQERRALSTPHGFADMKRESFSCVAKGLATYRLRNHQPSCEVMAKCLVVPRLEFILRKTMVLRAVLFDLDRARQRRHAAGGPPIEIVH